MKVGDKVTGYYVENKKYPSQIYRIYYKNGILWGSTMTMWQTAMIGQIETTGELNIKALKGALEIKKIVKLRPLKYKKHHKLLRDAIDVQTKARQSSQFLYNLGGKNV